MSGASINDATRGWDSCACQANGDEGEDRSVARRDSTHRSIGRMPSHGNRHADFIVFKRSRIGPYPIVNEIYSSEILFRARASSVHLGALYT